jgi:hypothetical protein
MQLESIQPYVEYDESALRSPSNLFPLPNGYSASLVSGELYNKKFKRLQFYNPQNEIIKIHNNDGQDITYLAGCTNGMILFGDKVGFYRLNISDSPPKCKKIANKRTQTTVRSCYLVNDNTYIITSIERRNSGLEDHLPYDPKLGVETIILTLQSTRNEGIFASGKQIGHDFAGNFYSARFIEPNILLLHFSEQVSLCEVIGDKINPLGVPYRIPGNFPTKMIAHDGQASVLYRLNSEEEEGIYSVWRDTNGDFLGMRIDEHAATLAILLEQLLREDLSLRILPQVLCELISTYAKPTPVDVIKMAGISSSVMLWKKPVAITEGEIKKDLPPTPLSVPAFGK